MRRGGNVHAGDAPGACAVYVGDTAAQRRVVAAVVQCCKNREEEEEVSGGGAVLGDVWNSVAEIDSWLATD